MQGGGGATAPPLATSLNKIIIQNLTLILTQTLITVFNHASTNCELKLNCEYPHGI